MLGMFGICPLISHWRRAEHKGMALIDECWVWKRAQRVCDLCQVLWPLRQPVGVSVKDGKLCFSILASLCLTGPGK